jgi:hypothetical protein
MMKKGVLLSFICMFLFIFWVNKAPCYDFCVYPGGAAGTNDFQIALTTAQSNGQGDTIRVVQGTYMGYYSYISGEGHSISVLGGYTSGCGSRVLDPSNTILNGGLSGPILALEDSDGGDMFVQGFTFQNDAIASRGGRKFFHNLYVTYQTIVF